jgi:methylthioribose-1-phosphate isomerase
MQHLMQPIVDVCMNCRLTASEIMDRNIFKCEGVPVELIDGIVTYSKVFDPPREKADHGSS